MGENGRRVFVSHANSDHVFASRIAKALSNAGVKALGQIEVGTRTEGWDEAILADIRSSDILVFVVPEREGAGKNALAELGAAYALGKPIVGVVPNASRYHNAEVARMLSRTAVVDASTMADDQALAEAIMTPMAA